MNSWVAMSSKYDRQTVGFFELESLGACFIALDAASKAANVEIQGVERNRLRAAACVCMRGSISDVTAAMEAALAAAQPITEILSHTIIPSPVEGSEATIHSLIFKS